MTTDATYNVAFSRYSLEQKIPNGSEFWQRFNGSFVNQSLPVMDIAEMIYQGHPLTTWHKDHWRAGKNFLMGQHLGLDYDTEDARSTVNALISDKFISRYAALIHTTISHRPEAPRARVLFLLDKPIQQAENYGKAIEALLWLFDSTDDHCKDAGRFFYGAPGCEMACLGNVLTLDKVKDLIHKHAESKPKRKPVTHMPHTTEQNEVAAALRLIPAWGITYREWLDVLMGIHAEFGDAGLHLAESWGQEGYEGEIARKWRSFKPNGNGRGAIS